MGAQSLTVELSKLDGAAQGLADRRFVNGAESPSPFHLFHDPGVLGGALRYPPHKKNPPNIPR